MTRVENGFVEPHKWDIKCLCKRCQSLTCLSSQLSSALEERMDGSAVARDTDLAGKYMVWNPMSTVPVHFYYNDRPTAIRVAHKMAVANPGERFCVCKIVGAAETTKVQYTDYDVVKR
jgi:hypothetical protein